MSRESFEKYKRIQEKLLEVPLPWGYVNKVYDRIKHKYPDVSEQRLKYKIANVKNCKSYNLDIAREINLLGTFRKKEIEL